jgi:hypothetical protein
MLQQVRLDSLSITTNFDCQNVRGAVLNAEAAE